MIMMIVDDNVPAADSSIKRLTSSGTPFVRIWEHSLRVNSRDLLQEFTAGIIIAMATLVWLDVAVHPEADAADHPLSAHLPQPLRDPASVSTAGIYLRNSQQRS